MQNLSGQKRVLASVMGTHGTDYAGACGAVFVRPEQIYYGLDNPEIIHLGLWAINTYDVHPDSKRILHWAGSDVLQYKHMSEWIKAGLFAGIKAHACNNEEMKQELSGCGVKDAVVMPFYPSGLKELAGLPMPESVAFGAYAPPYIHYHPEIYEFLASVFPDIPFYITGVSDITQVGCGINKNIILIGRKDYDKSKFYSQISVLFRFTDHDSLPRGLIEAAAARRHIITNYQMPDWEGGEEPVSIEGGLDEVLARIRTTDFTKPASEELSRRWLEKANPVLFKEKVDVLFEGIKKE